MAEAIYTIPVELQAQHYSSLFLSYFHLHHWVLRTSGHVGHHGLHRPGILPLPRIVLELSGGWAAKMQRSFLFSGTRELSKSLCVLFRGLALQTAFPNHWYPTLKLL